MKYNINVRIAQVPCVECGCPLEFRIENDVVIEGEGVIAVNIPGAICPDCIGSVLNKIPDPPGLICFRELSSTLAKELLKDFDFVLPDSEARKFYDTLFPGFQS